MFSDIASSFINNDAIASLARLFICFNALFLVLAINFLQRALSFRNITKNPDGSFADKNLADFTRKQNLHLNSEIRLDIIKGVLGCISSMWGVFLIISFFSKSSAEYSAFVFSAFSVVAITIRSAFISINCVFELKSYKESCLSLGLEDQIKKFTSLTDRTFARAASLTAAGLLLSIYLLYHVNPVL